MEHKNLISPRHAAFSGIAVVGFPIFVYFIVTTVPNPRVLPAGAMISTIAAVVVLSIGAVVAAIVTLIAVCVGD